MSKKGFGKFLAGAAIGAGLGVLFAPKKGEETRADLKVKLEELIAKAREIDVCDVKEEIEQRAMDIKNELEDLDKEKVKKIAKEKGKVLKKKAEELYKYAVKEGTPVLEKLADDVRIKTLEVVKQVENKLEK